MKQNETKKTQKQTPITIIYPDGSKRRFGSRSTASRFINAGFRRHGSDEAFYASLMRQFEDMQTTLYWNECEIPDNAATSEPTNEDSENTDTACVIEVSDSENDSEAEVVVETGTPSKKPRAKKTDNPDGKFKFIGDDSVVRFEVGKEYVENLKDGSTARVKVVVRKGQIIKITHDGDINAKVQSKFLKVVDGIEVTCDLSIKAK